MKTALKSDYKYSLVVATSMGVRLVPQGSQPVQCSKFFEMQATSAETNVASISSYLGLSVKVLTAFVKDSPISSFIKSDLKSRNMDYEGPDIDQGGPWGYRHQFNIADSGFGCRGPRVLNDRAGEVGKTLNAKYFDMEKIFRKEGVQVLHLSGLIASLSEETGEFCVELASYAKESGTIISFDLNYRESFWKGRQNELRVVFRRIASLSDIIIGNEEDFQLCFGIAGPKIGGQGIDDDIENFKEMIQRARIEFPKASVFGTTLREVVDANEHMWGSILLVNDEWHIIKPRRIHVLDRIGGGDGFVGGLIYGVLKNWSPEKWSQFAWASGALATTFTTDYAQPIDEQQIWSVWQGNARVKR